MDGRFALKLNITTSFIVILLRLPIPITDTEGRVFALCASMPKDVSSWAGDMAEGVEALETARRDCDLKPEEVNHRRGDYMCLRTGVSIGGGQQQPTVADNSETNNRILGNLNRTRFFERLASFSTCRRHFWIGQYGLMVLASDLQNMGASNACTVR